MQNYPINGDSQFDLSNKLNGSFRNKYRLKSKRNRLTTSQVSDEYKTNREFEKKSQISSCMDNSVPEVVSKKEHPLMRSFKRYRIERLTRLFISKLKQTAVLSDPKQLNMEEENPTFLDRLLGDLEGIEVSSVWNNIVQGASFIGVIWLMILYTMCSVFPELQEDAVYTWSCKTIFAILLIQVFTNFFVKTFNDGKLVNQLNEIIMHYFKNGFKLDLLDLVLFLLDILIKDDFINFCRLRVIFKIPFILSEIDRIKNIVCVNAQRQQQWDLCMVFITNFFFAHVLSVLLNAIAYLDNNNWWVKHDLNDSDWYMKYIFGYYWGTNIMLTVGFGDYCATNWKQALALIFIEMVSCITLAYNINCVGNLMGSLRARDLEKNKNLRTFSRMYEESNCQNRDLENRINHFIVKTFEMKKDFNLEGQKQTLALLPHKLREEFVKRANIQVLQNLYFLDQMTTKTLKELALRLNKKITHPQEIVIKKGDKSKLHILYSGQINYIAFQNKRGRSDYIVIQNIRAEQKKYCHISLKEFVKKQEEKHYVSSVNYCIMYTIEQEEFEQVIREIKIDFEKYCHLRDQDSFDEVIEGLECSICGTKKHSKFECPRLHYVPLRQIICLKFRLKSDIGQRRTFVERVRPRFGIGYSGSGMKRFSTVHFQSDELLDCGLHDVDSKTLVRRISLLDEKSTLGKHQSPEMQILSDLDRMCIWKNYFPKHNLSFHS